MEDTLWVTYNYGKEECYRGLNPCFNGRYSLSKVFFEEYVSDGVVLILVLMEDTLWENQVARNNYKTSVLILVLMEDTLWGILSSCPGCEES